MVQYSEKKSQTNSNNEVSDQTTLSSALVGLDDLGAFLKSQGTERTGRGVPPLDKWNPENSSSMDIVIKANGEWWHEGCKVNRDALIHLFSTVLWLEDNNGEKVYYLKTPVEKIRIEVEDVPFLVNDVNVVIKEGIQWIEFITQTGDVIYLDDEHLLTMETYKGEMRPYVPVRFGMKGLITRHVLMHLTKIGVLSEHEGHTILSLKSGSKTYEVAVSNEGAE